MRESVEVVFVVVVALVAGGVWESLVVRPVIVHGAAAAGDV